MGYHVPTKAEINVLANFVGGFAIAGGEMKTTGTIQTMNGIWETPNTGATNNSGFSGEPSFRVTTSGVNSISNMDATWWSSDLGGSFKDIFELKHNSAVLFTGGSPKEYGYPIRCVKD